MSKMLFFLFFASLLLYSCTRQHVYQQAPFDGKEVRISIDGLGEGKPAFYTFYADGRKINYFVVKTKKSVSSYFDACSKCNPMKLGYKLEGDYIVCRACNVRYSVDDLKEGFGSCYPIKLAGKIEGRSYVIDKKVLQAGEKYF